MKLEDLQVDTHVLGIEPDAPVKILYLKKAGPDALDVTYELLSGQVLKKTLFRADEEKLAVASAGRVWPFDALPASFKLAAETTRIKLATSWPAIVEESHKTGHKGTQLDFLGGGT